MMGQWDKLWEQFFYHFTEKLLMPRKYLEDAGYEYQDVLQSCRHSGSHLVIS